MNKIADSETLQVNTLTCTYGEYRQLPTRKDRIALRTRVVDALVQAYRKDDSSPIRATYRFPYQFDQVFDRWEATVQTPMDELQERLASHDPYFAMTDDHGDWTRGRDNLARIDRLVQTLGPEAETLYKEYVARWSKAAV